MSPTTNNPTDTDKLQAHHQAYMHIFRSILKKRGLPAEQQQGILGRIKAYQHNKIKDADEYLDHIPVFAKALGVRPDQLGAYIGSHLLQALHQVEEQLAQKKKVAAQAQKVTDDPEIKKSILKEIVHQVGTIVEAPNRFVAQDRGLMALSINGNLQMAANAAEVDPSLATSMSGPGPSSSKSDSAGSTGPGPSGNQEQSILEEITSKLGEALKIEEKLVVPAFPREMQAAQAAAQPTVNDSPATDSGSGQEQSILEEITSKLGAALKVEEKLVVPPFPREMQAAQAAAQPTVNDSPATDSGSGQEQSILEEITSKLGAALKVEQKLVVSAFPDQDPLSNQAQEQTAGQQPDAEQENDDEIELTFGDFCDALRRVQAFQNKKDAAGYRNWLQNEVDPEIKLVLAIRKLQSQKAKDPQLNWSDELYNVATQSGFTLEQAQNLHSMIQKYNRMYQLQNQFIGRVKAQPPAVLQAFQKIWPQVKLIVDDESSLDGRMQRLKIPMLQITHPKLNAAVTKMLQTYFTKLQEIEES